MSQYREAIPFLTKAAAAKSGDTEVQFFLAFAQMVLIWILWVLAPPALYVSYTSKNSSDYMLALLVWILVNGVGAVLKKAVFG